MVGKCWLWIGLLFVSSGLNAQVMAEDIPVKLQAPLELNDYHLAEPAVAEIPGPSASSNLLTSNTTNFALALPRLKAQAPRQMPITPSTATKPKPVAKQPAPKAKAVSASTPKTPSAPAMPSPASQTPATPSPVAASPATNSPVKTNASQGSQSTQLLASAITDPPSTRANLTQPQPSKVQANLGQNLHITLPGLGWLYLGTGSMNDGVVYQQSIVENNATRFVLRLDGSGPKNLKFQRQDGQRGTMEQRDLNLEIDPTRAKGTVSTIIDNSPVPVAIPTDPSLEVRYTVDEVPGTPEAMLSLAQQKSSSGKSGEALALYNRIVELAPQFTAMDEVLFKKAQILETRSDKARIREAFELYVRIGVEYPYSSFADPSRQRARYLDRNFLNIR
jgi:hypothetical protein